MMSFLRSRRLLIGVLGLFLLVVLFALIPGQKVTRANFDKPAVGMSFDAVRGLLGPVDYVTTMKGVVDSPTQFHTNNDPEVQRRQNHRDYGFYQWASSELTVIAIFDEQGSLVCRYFGEPQVEPWHVKLLGWARSALGMG